MPAVWTGQMDRSWMHKTVRAYVVRLHFSTRRIQRDDGDVMGGVMADCITSQNGLDDNGANFQVSSCSTMDSC